jgi:phosphoribosylanthranilate isomerase
MRRLGRFWDKTERVHLKVCGIRNLDTAYSCHELGVDAIGLHVFGRPEGTPPCADWTSLVPEEMSVFLLTNETDPLALLELCERLRCDTVQIQGRKPPGEVRRVAEFMRPKGIAVVKSVGIGSEEGHDRPSEYIREIAGYVDAVLLDTAWRGGTGQFIDVNKARELAPFAAPAALIVAGGISAANIGDVICSLRPYGIDVESAVEWVWEREGRRITAKSVKKIEELVRSLRLCNQMSRGPATPGT